MMTHTNLPLSTSTSCARTLSEYSLEGAPLPLSMLSRQRSSKKHLAASLASSRTSAANTNAGPRVCPFCPDVVVSSQDLILLSFRKENKKEN